MLRELDWMTYIMIILASYRFTHLIVFDKITEFILIRREDSHFNEAKRSKWEMNRLNYILLKIG
ncbi:hypothetical protein A3Q36_14190 [Geobacillus stearothermophilus]|nr:hypothetical protein A3Q36_14190 [Geobacillus stearothermophilus]